jgi:copper homeostasis protein
MHLIEIACFNEQSAITAWLGGADRIELCRDKNTDGLTPTAHALQYVLHHVNIPVNVMIRPREGNFIYTEEEFEQMKNEILGFKNSGVAGFVFGCLNPNHTVNMAQNKVLLALANPLPCTFHKAFDACADLNKSLEDLIMLGFETVLTSGGSPTALEGVEQLLELKPIATGKINILVGGSVRSHNLQAIKAICGLNQYHSSGIIDGGELADLNEILAIVKSAIE